MLNVYILFTCTDRIAHELKLHTILSLLQSLHIYLKPKWGVGDSGLSETSPHSRTLAKNHLQEGPAADVLSAALEEAQTPQEELVQFYTAVIETVLCTSITVWFGAATKQEKNQTAAHHQRPPALTFYKRDNNCHQNSFYVFMYLGNKAESDCDEALGRQPWVLSHMTWHVTCDSHCFLRNTLQDALFFIHIFPSKVCHELHELASSFL